MFFVLFQRFISAKGIGVINRAFPGLGLDMSPYFFCTDRLDNFGAGTTFLGKQRKQGRITGDGPSTFAFASSVNVGSSQFDPAFEVATLQFCLMGERFPQLVIGRRNDFAIYRKILTQSIGWSRLIDLREDKTFPSQSTPTLAFPTKLIFPMAPPLCRG
jgi:hypothetical protein